jgi:hypothetical protein
LGELIGHLLDASRAFVTIRSLSPCRSVTFAGYLPVAFAVGAIDGGLRFAPLGLPDWPGLN